MTLLIHLGVKVSLISNQVYQLHFKKLPLYAPFELAVYDGGTITALGCFDAKVAHKGNFQFFGAARSRSVMEVNLFDALGFKVIDPDKVHIAMVEQAASSVTLSTQH